ncbi:ATP-dependent dethiobiotin synthetase BioD [Kitasatospora sp. NE20-6]|uniref:dethiobiotin synthase n=1 Tax=Kitasatospora sp. NE20-6 TaxID=2859066 RepID=UPI0034DB7EDB
MTVLFVTGTGTEVGKTVATAAVAALADGPVAVLKPGQTGVAPGEPGDVAEVLRLTGRDLTVRELARYPEPLAPDTAARRSGLPPVGPGQVAEAVAELAAEHPLVLVEGAGGLLVRYDDEGRTLADMARAAAALGLAPAVLLVASAGLGTLNTTALTAEALRARGLDLRGVVIGAWPAEPDLAMRCNLADLPTVAGAPLLGALPLGAAAVGGEPFTAAARAALAPALGGTWDAAAFTAAHAVAPPGR